MTNSENQENILYDVVEENTYQLSKADAEYFEKCLEDGVDPFDVERVPEGLKQTLEKYLEYAKEVIINRAIPDIYDGLKPVQRMSLYLMSINDKMKKGLLVKSASVVGSILPYHPHGDTSVYDAIVRMTQKKGVLNVPLVRGKGGFGDPFSRDPAAAMRYTELGYVDYFSELISTPQGVGMIYTEDMEEQYMEYMPVSFPLILTNPSSGVSVGLSTNILPFNVKELIALIEEYLNTGKMTQIIVPDFATGGMIVQNQKELKRIMSTGKGTLKVRANTEIVGKEIRLLDLPYGVVHEKIDKELTELQENGYLTDVTDWYDSSGRNKKTSIGESRFAYTIECRSAGVAESVLLELYNKTSLQSYYHSNIIVIKNGSPKACGVYNIIREWVKWRKQVVTKQAEYNLEAIGVKLPRLEIFLNITQDREYLQHLTALVQSGKKQEAFQDIMEKYDTDRDSAVWVIDRKLSQFDSIANRYKTEYERLKSDFEYWDDTKKNPEKYILADMDRIKTIPELYKDRKTEITNVDYNFIKREEETLANEDAFYVVENGFIKKLETYPYVHSDDAFILEGKSSDVILCIDDEGHILRVYGEELPFNLQSDRGTYIPRYCGFEQDLFIMWADIAKTDKKFMLLYSDGYVGHLDTTKFARENVNQRSRVQMMGIYYDTSLLEDIVPYEPEKYLVIRQETARTQKLGVVQLGEVKIRASKARTKVMNATEVTDWGLFTENELNSQFFPLEDYLLNEEDKKMKRYEGDLPVHID